MYPAFKPQVVRSTFPLTPLLFISAASMSDAYQPCNIQGIRGIHGNVIINIT